MKKICNWVKLMIEWIGSFSHEEDGNQLEEILNLRKQNIELSDRNYALQQMYKNLLEERFGNFKSDDLDINTLQLQYGSFFINAAFDRHFQAEELYFFKRTFMQAIACAYFLGLKKNERPNHQTTAKE